MEAFGTEGFVLHGDGVLSPRVLDGLSGNDLTAALDGYVRRAKKGVADAALLTGTSKDLLEATAAHILMTRFGQTPDEQQLLDAAWASVCRTRYVCPQ